MQLLCLEAAVHQQQQQLQQWGISRLRKHTHAPDALLYPGMVVAVKGRLQQARTNTPILLLSLMLPPMLPGENDKLLLMCLRAHLPGALLVWSA